MLVSKNVKITLPPTQNIKFAFPPTQTLNANQRNIGCFGSPKQHFCIVHAHLIFVDVNLIRFGSCFSVEYRLKGFKTSAHISSPLYISNVLNMVISRTDIMQSLLMEYISIQSRTREYWIVLSLMSFRLWGCHGLSLDTISECSEFNVNSAQWLNTGID